MALEPGEVLRVELYFYEPASVPGEVNRTTITDPAMVEELVEAFTDVPAGTLASRGEDLQAARVTGLRYHLVDGSTRELTQYFLQPRDVVIAWPDAPAQHTTWGVPLEDYFADLGDSDEVDSSLRPASSLEE
ncbi:hypothetical protein [Serinibacter salmoneus]|uniref:hypothetical protein n=1 Tax=Serinibacter salmoneus TaxID=556530 RepID=UPI000BF3E778|nr:hypothetical protein [Serinibacter salmoneus]